MEKTTAVRGDLAYRLLLNYSILESYRYRADYIFTADKSAWYGDWEGRTILALVRLCEATGREPAFLVQIIDAFLARCSPTASSASSSLQVTIGC